MGTVLHQALGAGDRAYNFRFSPLLDGDGVASEGQQHQHVCYSRFSPLLDGDGVASRKGRYVRTASAGVSVPFSMGTVLHHQGRNYRVKPRFRFSPLLDGDGVASNIAFRATVGITTFQSPSRWGRCCIAKSKTS